MTLPFKMEVINDTEYSKYNFKHPRFIGYLNKYGQVLKYGSPLGIGGHNDNKLTTYFENNFRMPSHNIWIQQSENRSVLDLDSEYWWSENRKSYFKEKIEDKINLAKRYGYNASKDVNSRFLDDLNVFFYNCYQAKTFMDGFGQNCMILNEYEFYQKYCKILQKYQRNINETEEQYKKRTDSWFEYDYYWYKKELMLEWYKTVIVQYLHYHLIERCQKGITTSDLTPYETFYNYLLNDFTIHQIPRMVYDNEKKMYIFYEQNNFLVTDRELRLKEEVQAIKKYVPINEREKYYR